MNKKVLILIIVLVVLIAGAAAGYNFLTVVQPPEPEQEQEQEQGSDNGFKAFKAVDFYVYDGEGKRVYLSDFEGKRVIVNFWATWCEPCQMEFPAFEAIYEQYGDEAVFLMINQTDGELDTVESVKAFVEKNELDFPVYFDSDLIATRTYGIYAVPLTFVVDEAGMIVDAHSGPISEEGLLDFLGK